MKYSGFLVCDPLWIFRGLVKEADMGGIVFVMSPNERLHFEGVMLEPTIDFFSGADGKNRTEC